jgi:hypothetical protein
MVGRWVSGRGLVLAAAMITAGLAAITPASAEDEPVITWPSIAQFNPTSTSYPLTVTYGGPGFVFLTKYNGSVRLPAQPLPANSTTDVTFVGFDGRLTLAPVLCPTETYSTSECTAIKTPKSVQVYDEFVAKFGRRDQRGPHLPFSVTVQPAGGGTFDAAWEIVPADDPAAAPLVEGSADDLLSGAIYHQFPAPAADVLTDGERYLLRATFAGSSDPYGPLAGNASTEFIWDGGVDLTGLRFVVWDEVLDQAIEDVDVFYPGGDHSIAGWRDDVSPRLLPAVHEHLRNFRVTATSRDGVVVFDDTGSDYIPSWNGRDMQRDLVDEGTYTVEVTAMDDVGNEGTVSGNIRVSHKALVRTTWQKTISAQRSMFKRFVGRCAAIKVPARHAWAESVGLRSSDVGRRCRTVEAQSATSLHGVDLPRSPLGHYELYDRVRVSAYGAGTPSADWSYLVHWYWSRKGEWIGRTQFDRKVGWHSGLLFGSRVVLGDESDEHPYVVWSVGLAEGAKYDVKSFKVSVRYWDIR